MDTPTDTSQQPFNELDPDSVMAAVESVGFVCSGHQFPLNSYENRVYQVGIDTLTDDVEPPLIAKFYRPNRWSDEQIREEHQFCFELAEQELPVVAPLQIHGESLFHFKDYRFALYPRRGGHAPELDNPDHLYQLGQLLGRIHGVGAVRPFQHRPSLNADTYGHQSVAFISEHIIPAELKASYDSVALPLLDAIDDKINGVNGLISLRTHSDCHGGNILWRDDSAAFVDLDDARMAPAIQDIWMLLSGSRDQQRGQLSEVIDGYDEFYDFHPRELALIESLRSLRMLHHAAWLAKRWDDPAFPMAFPWFNTERYWGEHILELREQLIAMKEPPLSV